MLLIRDYTTALYQLKGLFSSVRHAEPNREDDDRRGMGEWLIWGRE
jgi:hypothetical protein